MIKKFLFIVFLLLLPITTAYYDSESLTINLNMSTELEIIPTGGSYIIDTVTANLTFFPQDDVNQKIISYDSRPKAIIDGGVAQFIWKSPELGKLDFFITSYIETKNNPNPIRSKVDFPVDIPDWLVPYTQPADKIDSQDRSIILLASSLANGEDDLFVVVNKLADWIKKNIDYSITTSTLEANQDASWVLENKKGLCDELTNLFIAMARSLGIPAKFVSGISYTTSDKFSQPYGSHGWAEVYFPGYGWVPFDVTYNEFGYIDPTHVKLIESIDSNKAATNYQWIGKNIDVETHKLNINASIISSKGKVPSPVSISAQPIEAKVGFGSYNIVKAAIENLQSYYISEELTLSKPPELQIIDEIKHRVILKPKEKKAVYWKVKAGNLDERFAYQFPLVVYTSRNDSAPTSFNVGRDSLVLSASDADSIIHQNREEIKKIYSRQVDFSCTLIKGTFLQNEVAITTCRIKNTGNVLLEDISICSDKCEKIDLGISQEVSLEFQIDTITPGKHKMSVEAKSPDISKVSYVDYEVLDEPRIGIVNLEYPSEVAYEEDFSITFMMSKESFAAPKDIKIELVQKGFKETWELAKLVDDHRLSINMHAKDFVSIDNTFTILITHDDRYQTKESFNINIKDPTISEKVRIMINGIASFIVGIFT